MTTTPSQSEPRTPDEGRMLAFVEGELSAADEVLFRRSLRHAPPVLARLEAMRRDKALLRASMLRESLVPGSLATRVEEAISREALLTAAAGEPPLGIVEPVIRTRVHARWRIGRHGPALVPAMSMAAALAIVVGGAVLVINATMVGGSGGAGPRGARPAALAGNTADEQAATGEADSSSATTIASGADPSGTSHGAESDSDAGPDSIVAAGGQGQEPVDQIALSPGDALDPSADLPPIDIPEPLVTTRLLPGGVARRDLMALAEQHRLALRISADEPGQVIAALEAAALSDTESGWRVVADAPATLAGSLSVAISPFGEDDFAVPAGGSGGPGSLPDALPDEPSDAFDPDRGPASEPEGPGRDSSREDDDWLLRPTEDAWAVYLTEVDLTEEGLAALDRDLREAGQSRAGFAALADPLDSVLGERIMLIPAGDVMWWYHPPREWSRRTLVPVVVERK